MTAIVSTQRHGQILVVTIDNPPANAILAVRAEKFMLRLQRFRKTTTYEWQSSQVPGTASSAAVGT